jgi:hypothetical protein
VRRILLAAAVLLTGCVSPYAKLYSEIPQYKGQNIDALVDRIGYPDSQDFMSGRIIYSWTAASTVQMVSQPVPAPEVAILPYQYFARSSEPETVSLHFPCRLQVDTDGSGTILDLSWEGKPGSCAPQGAGH